MYCYLIILSLCAISFGTNFDSPISSSHGKVWPGVRFECHEIHDSHGE